MKKKVVNSVKVLFIISILLTSFAAAFAHGDEEVHYNSVMKILPFYYIAEEDYFGGILVTIFWVGLLYGLYNLIIMVIGRELIK